MVLNLIGNEKSNPSLPNVFKWDSISETITGDLISFVDDLRAIGYSLEQAWEIARWVASKLEYLGIQDTPRKRRIDNGPCAGALFDTKEDKITKTVTQEKWIKAKGYT